MTRKCNAVWAWCYLHVLRSGCKPGQAGGQRSGAHLLAEMQWAAREVEWAGRQSVAAGFLQRPAQHLIIMHIASVIHSKLLGRQHVA